MIEDGSSIITEPSVVASSMNTFFSNVALAASAAVSVHSRT